MNLHNSLAIGCLYVVLFSGCNSESVKEQVVKKSIAPMENPNHAVNYARIVRSDGKERTSRFLALRDGIQHWEVSNGCKFRQLGMFAPASRWEGCEPFSNGIQTVKQSGTPWPLSIGKRWSYTFAGNNANGNQWKGTRECEAESTARITTATGQHDTFKVVCEDEYSNRTYYISPALKDYAKLVRWRKRAGETTTFELLKAG